MKLEQEVVTVNHLSQTAPLVSQNELAGAAVFASTHAPENVRATTARLVREGITAAKAGDLNAARGALQQAIELDDRHEMALMWLASISDKPSELFELLQKVLSINPANERAAQWAESTKTMLAKALMQQGVASHKEGMPEIARQYFLQAAEYQPTNQTAWLWLVSVSSEPEDKLSYLNRILSLNPQHEKALALFHRTKSQIALSLLQKGNAAMVAGDRTTALEILRDVMDYNPNLPEAWLFKASLCEDAGERGACFERVLQISPENEAAQQGLADLARAAQEAAQQAEQERFAAEAIVSEPPAPQLLSEDQSENNFVEDEFAETVAPDEFAVQNYAGENFVGEKYVEVPNADDINVEEPLVAEELPFETSAAPETFVGAQQSFMAPGEFSEIAQTIAPTAKVECLFCKFENQETEPRCNRCGAFVRLEDFEALVNNELHDESVVRNFIEENTGENNGSESSATISFNLGLAFINLRNAKKAVGHFESAMRTDIDNEAVNARINALLDYLKEKMPEVLGVNASKTGKTIMVVDDSPTVRKLIASKLEKYGHQVVAAVDGMDALSKINETVPDLIFLDVTMPRLDGYQLCKLVKANSKTKHVPVVMISGKDGFFDKVRGRMAGSTAYITKPFGPETLLQTVETYCK